VASTLHQTENPVSQTASREPPCCFLRRVPSCDVLSMLWRALEGGDDAARAATAEGRLLETQQAGAVLITYSIPTIKCVFFPTSFLSWKHTRVWPWHQVLVQERLAREVSDAMLSETTKALSAVRAAAVSGGGARATGIPLEGGTEQQKMLLNGELNRLRDEYDALRHETRHKDSQLEEMQQKVAGPDVITFSSSHSEPFVPVTARLISPQRCSSRY